MWILWLETFSRIGLYFSTAMWAGLPFAWFVIAQHKSDPLAVVQDTAHLQKWVRNAAVFAAIAATTLFAAQMLGVGPENISIPLVQWFVFESELGWTWGGRVLVAGLAWVVLHKSPAQHWWWIASLTGLLMQISISLNGHTAAHSPGPDVLIALGHLIGSALWAGGLVLLSTHLPQWCYVTDRHRPALAIVQHTTQRFGLIGIAGVGLLVASGLSLTALHLPNLSQLNQTQYGGTLTFKVVLAFGAMILGAIHWLIVPYFLKTSSHIKQFMLSIQIETIIVLCALFLAGRLTSLSPGHVAHDTTDLSITSTALKIAAGIILIGGIGALVWQLDKCESNS
ncbi:MAG: CopD family protein [Anaerolineae bacterium]|nr:CopD family protein [Anaerolineae bacterium]